MHADQRTAEPFADLRNGKAGCVGSENAIRFADIIQFTEKGLLDGHFFKSRFNDQVAIRAKLFFKPGIDPGKDRSDLLRVQFSLSYQFFISGSDSFQAVFRKCLINIAEQDFISINLSKRFGNTLAHGTGANNSNFHFITS